MHTFSIIINDETFVEIKYTEILPLLREQNLVVWDVPLKINTTIDLIKSIAPKVIVCFLQARLNKHIEIKQNYTIEIYTNEYKTIEDYEETVCKENERLTPITYDEHGIPENLYKLSGERLEVELSKKGYVYNYKTYTGARAALREIILREDTPSPPVSGARTRAQTSQERIPGDPDTENRQPSTSTLNTLKTFQETLNRLSTTFADSGIFSTPGNPEPRDSLLSNLPPLPETPTGESEFFNFDNNPPNQNPESNRSPVISIHSERETSESESSDSEARSENEEQHIAGNMAAPLNPTKLGIPKCSGTPKETERLIAEINRQKKVNNWNDDVTRQYFYLSLQGPCQTWWENKEEFLNGKTWEELKVIFRNRFQATPGTTTWTKFTNRKQQEGENALDYYEEKNKLMKLTDIPLDDAKALDFFVEGLLPETRLQVKYRMPEENCTLEQLLKIIEKVQKVLLEEGTSSSSSANHEIKAMMIGLQNKIEALSNSRLENNVEQLVVATIARLTGPNNTANPPEITCYECKGKNHFAKDCKAPGKQERKPSNSMNSLGGGRSRSNSRDRSLERTKIGQPICQLCSSPGHSALSCAKLQIFKNGDHPKN